jgi:ACS family hexuronate transporter-like MFS transporter
VVAFLLMPPKQSDEFAVTPVLVPSEDGTVQLSYGSSAISHIRWIILTLIFLGTAINYMDRQVLSVLAPELKRRFVISDEGYGNIQAAFSMAYAIGQLASGGWLDRVGTRLGYSLALAVWSLASMLHALARSAFGFGAARMLLGVSESPNYPVAVKVLAEWFPRSERAFGMGVVNSGTLVGAVAVPAVIPWLTIQYGWQSAFIVTGLLGFLWLGVWLLLYRRPEDHRGVSAAELAHIRSDPPDTAAKVRWLTLLTYPQAWAFAIGKFLTDPLWWFYMSWFPNFLNEHHGLNLSHLGPPLVVIYGMSGVGSLFGGWLSSAMLKSGSSVNAARKTGMLVSALIVVPVVFAAHVSSLWLAVVLMGLATAGHQGFSSNLYTLVSDMFPKRACGSIAGLGGCFGYVGATLFMSLTGLIVGRWTHQNYTILFVMAGCGYLAAFLVIQILSPRLEPASLPTEQHPM